MLVLLLVFHAGTFICIRKNIGCAVYQNFMQQCFMWHCLQYVIKDFTLQCTDLYTKTFAVTCGSGWQKLQSCSLDSEEGSEGPHGDRKNRGEGGDTKRRGGEGSRGERGGARESPPPGPWWAEWHVHSGTCRHRCNHQHFPLCDIRKSLPPKLLLAF